MKTQKAITDECINNIGYDVENTVETAVEAAYELGAEDREDELMAKYGWHRLLIEHPPRQKDYEPTGWIELWRVENHPFPQLINFHEAIPINCTHWRKIPPP